MNEEAIKIIIILSLPGLYIKVNTSALLLKASEWLQNGTTVTFQQLKIFNYLS
jgi:hypothetical protein